MTVEGHPLLPSVDAEEAGDAAAPQQTEGVGHHLRVPRTLDEVEPAEVAAPRGDVGGAGFLDQRLRRLERRRHDLDALEAKQERDERADGARADDERALQLPRLTAADDSCVPQCAHAIRHRLGEDAETSQVARDRNELRRILADELAGEPVQARDAALAVVTGEARVRRALSARDAMPARPAHCRRDEVAAREAGGVSLDDAERLVSEHEQLLPFGRNAEEAVDDLAVGPAYAHLEHAHRHLAGADLGRCDLVDARAARDTGLDDERLHPSTAPSVAGPTSARYRASTPPASERGGLQAASRSASSASPTSTASVPASESIATTSPS